MSITQDEMFTRDVACGICDNPLYYMCDPRFVPEIIITIERPDRAFPDSKYFHRDCFHRATNGKYFKLLERKLKRQLAACKK